MTLHTPPMILGFHPRLHPTVRLSLPSLKWREESSWWWVCDREGTVWGGGSISYRRCVHTGRPYYVCSPYRSGRAPPPPSGGSAPGAASVPLPCVMTHPSMSLRGIGRGLLEGVGQNRQTNFINTGLSQTSHQVNRCLTYDWINQNALTFLKWNIINTNIQ